MMRARSLLHFTGSLVGLGLMTLGVLTERPFPLFLGFCFLVLICSSRAIRGMQ